jgi:hypothetical protein
MLSESIGKAGGASPQFRNNNAYNYIANPLRKIHARNPGKNVAG